MENKGIKNWLINHITKNPMIPYGSLWRDFCFTKISKSNSEFNSAINSLKRSKKITVIIKDLNSFYDLSTELKRDKILTDILKD